MDKFLNIGGKVINLDNVTAMYDGKCDNHAAVTVRFTSDANRIQFSGEDRALLLAWMARQERLLSAQDHMRQQIVNDAFNPFIDTDKLTAIYSLFNDIPGHERLVLCLESEEVGCVRAKDNLSELLVSWKSAIEAVGRLHAYHQGVQDAMDGDEALP